MRSACIFAGAVALCAALNGGVGTEAHAQYSRETPIVRAVRKTQGGVVALKVEKRGSWGRRESVGAGIVVDERGYLITNRHVIAGADQIVARLFDGTELPAQVAVDDAGHDLAILRVKPARSLQALTLGPASDLMVGETVIALGHPFGYTNTVSTGIVSALGRQINLPGGELLTNLIQTNAAINPGNSGGPLLNINGEVIGINVALRDGAQGIAFALNADVVQQALSKHLSAGKLAQVSHGLRCAESLCSESLARQQVVVEEVVSAAASGLRRGDQIVRVGDRGVSNRFDVERALWDHKAGDRIALTVARDGKLMTVDLVLGRPAASQLGAGR